MSESVGKYLKEQREAKGITLDEIADETKIQKRYLEYLENEEFEELPGEAYVKGFLRNYSIALNINSDKVIEMYKKTRLKDEPEEEEQEEKEETVIIEKAKVKKLNVFILCFIITLLILGSYLVIKSRMSSEKEEPVNLMEKIAEKAVEKKESMELKNKKNNIKKEVEMENKSNVKKLEAVMPEIVEEKKFQGTEKIFEINIKENSWLEIKEGNKNIFGGLAFAGDKKIIKSKKSVYIKVGKASKVSIKLNGQEIEMVGDKKTDLFKQTWK